MHQSNDNCDDSMLSYETPFSQADGISEGTALLSERFTTERFTTESNVEEGSVVGNTNGNADGGLNGGSIGANTSGTRLSQYEIDELDKPWPATFERSISLLAGPIMDTQKIDDLTKSPKITPNLSLRRENAHYVTPESRRDPSGMMPPGRSFKKEINKVQSLDFVKMESKTGSNDAKNYRQKLLEEARRKKQGAVTGAPVDVGVAVKKGKKKKKQDDGHGHGVGGDEKATYGQCVFNMCNILMGVGMLGLPFIYKSAGWIGGTFVSLIFSAVTWRTSILLGRELNGDPRPGALFDENNPNAIDKNLRLRKGLTSFPQIAREAFGNSGTIILSIALYFELFSCLCIFFVTLGDHLHQIFPGISVTHHMVHIAFILTIPTALLRTPRLLSYLSTVGTIATACVVLTVLSSGFTIGDVSKQVANEKEIEVASTHILWQTSGLPLAFGLMAYVYSGHAIVPAIYSSMQRPQDYELMITMTYIAVTSCCLIVAISGYYVFGSAVEDQITLSLADYCGSGDIMIKGLTWLMILTAFSKFTLSAFPLALGLEELLAPVVPSDNVMEWVSSLIKIVLIAASLFVAIFVPNFGFLCSLVGLICTMIVSVIFPAGAHLKMFGPHLPAWEKILDWIFIIGGTMMSIIGTIQAIS